MMNVLPPEKPKDHSPQGMIINQSSPPASSKRLQAELLKKDQQLRSVAHDLRNPLGGIASLANIMIEQEEASPELVEMLTAIKEAADHSLKLVKDLLVAGDQPEVTAVQVSIDHIIEHCARLAQHAADAKEQQLILDLFDDDAKLIVNKDQFTRVIDNLISNAIKFTGIGGKIIITTRQLSEGIQLTVKDYGVGIPAHLQHKIFEGMPETRREGTSGEISHGLGLPICKQLIESFGGTISFQSKAGKGTIFYIWLPGAK